MDQQVTPQQAQAAFALPRWEFISICAGLMALNALAIDIMLPGLQQIGASLGVTDENHRQFVIPAYFLGMAAALLFYGPLSDRFGRRPPLFVGLAIYIIAAFAAAFAPSFEALLALRFVQGIGAASTRVIAVSIVRDRFGGRAMAEVMSLIFMVFMIIPVIAPIGVGPDGTRKAALQLDNKSPADIGNLVLTARDGRPVYVRDVADVDFVGGDTEALVATVEHGSFQSAALKQGVTLHWIIETLRGPAEGDLPAQRRLLAEPQPDARPAARPRPTGDSARRRRLA